MYRIFIVEDDETIAGLIKKHLEGWDYEVEASRDLKNVLTEFEAFSPQLTLLDIGLPFHSGFYWCKEIRKISKSPVVFLSSASDNMNIITAMDMGGDDFLAKPFDLSVLTAKIGALLRRTYDFGAKTDVIEYHGAVLNIAEAALCVSGEKCELTKNELGILLALLENKGRIVSRGELINRLWETESYIDDNTLSVNVSRLRKKLLSAGLSDCIVTKAGLGYIIVE